MTGDVPIPGSPGLKQLLAAGVSRGGQERTRICPQLLWMFCSLQTKGEPPRWSRLWADRRTGSTGQYKLMRVVLT